MSMKQIIARQYRENVSAARAKLAGLQTPSEGWLRTMRTSLGMSGAQLARRMGLTRDAISKFEKAELDGGITIKSMQSLAQSMNARFVYAIVPEGDIDEIIERRAHQKAEKLVKEASVHMALEAQSLSQERYNEQVKRLAREMLDTTPSKLWDDE